MQELKKKIYYSIKKYYLQHLHLCWAGKQQCKFHHFPKELFSEKKYDKNIIQLVYCGRDLLGLELVVLSLNY